MSAYSNLLEDAVFQSLFGPAYGDPRLKCAVCQVPVLGKLALTPPVVWLNLDPLHIFLHPGCGRTLTNYLIRDADSLDEAVEWWKTQHGVDNIDLADWWDEG